MITDESFAKEIEKIKEETGLNYIDSINLWCDKNGEEGDAAEALRHVAAVLVKKDPALKQKILHEAANLHLLKISTSGNTLFNEKL